MLVPEENTGTAFGAMTAVQNCGLALVNLLVNVIRGTYGDEAAMIFFVVADCLGLLGALLLYFVDQKRGGQLCTVKTNDVIVPKTIDDANSPEYDNPFA
jgi:MFS-type transporter involved in bile tolerance (Atg22 family)